MAAWPKPYFRAGRSLNAARELQASYANMVYIARKIGAVANYIAFSYVVVYCCLVTISLCTDLNISRDVYIFGPFITCVVMSRAHKSRQIKTGAVFERFS